MKPERVIKACEMPSRPRSRLRYCLISLSAFVITVALFYAEEDWRGWKAMENCKRQLEAQGVSLRWPQYIPPPVADDENVFGVPEMQAWFVKHDAPGSNDLMPRMHYPGWENPARTVVAQLRIDLPGALPPSSSAATMLRWDDPQAKATAVRLIKDALGPVAIDPQGPFYTLKKPEEIRPMQIYLQCQIQPGEQELRRFLAQGLFSSNADFDEGMRVERARDGSYAVTVPTPRTAAEYLVWNRQLEPVFALVRQALERPYAQIKGDYSKPSEFPIVNFRAYRAISQRLAAAAECNLVLGHPDEALRDLTLIHDLCHRTLERSKPMPLVSAMINVMISGIYASNIADGLRLQAWREPQLAALEGQLEQIDLLGPVRQAYKTERLSLCYHLSTETPVQYFKNFTSWRKNTNFWERFWSGENSLLPALIPEGWAGQNMFNGANYYTNVFPIWDPANQVVYPSKVRAADDALYAFFSHAIAPHWSPYFFMALPDIPNVNKASQLSARTQSLLHEALTACALARYHQAYGAYPETLAALTPQFIDAIPNDVIGGQPLHYRLAPDGTFILYSVGWNGRDDGGARGNSLTEGDWVWPEN